MQSSKFAEFANKAAAGLDTTKLNEFTSESKILITGGTGLVGQSFVRVLDAFTAPAGATLYLSVRNEQRARAQFSDLATANVEYIAFADVTDLANAGVKFTHIVHMASPATPHDFSEHIMDVLHANVDQTNTLLDVAHATGAHFVMASTLEIYGDIPLPDQNSDLLLTEDMQGVVNNLAPRAIYPESKRLAENLCAIHSNMRGGRASIARISHTFGPGFADTDDRVQNQFLRQATSGQEIVLQSDGSMRRTYTYSLDVGTALVAIMLRKNASELAAYNIAAVDNMISIRQLAELTLEAADRQPSELRFDIPTGAPMWSGNRGGLVPATGKLESETGWRSQYSVLAGLREVIATFDPR